MPPPNGPAAHNAVDRAFRLARVKLGEGTPGVTVDENSERAELSLLGMTYATIERAGRSVRIRFLLDGDERKAVAGVTGYTTEPNRKNWVCIRLGQDPQRWEAARVEVLVGRTLEKLRAMASLGRWKNVVSETGPYVIIGASSVTQWNEDGEDADLAAATSLGTHSARLQRPWGSVLVLGNSGPLYFKPEPFGGLFIRVRSEEPCEEPTLRALVSAVPETVYSPTGLEFEVPDALWAFAATHSGRSVDSMNSLTCELTAGSYRLLTGVHTASPKVTMFLDRLQRI